MAGHGTNKVEESQKKGHRTGLKTKGRNKPVPTNIALKREQKKRRSPRY